jgi:hypothetical protein
MVEVLVEGDVAGAGLYEERGITLREGLDNLQVLVRRGGIKGLVLNESR